MPEITETDIKNAWNEYFGDSQSIHDWLDSLKPELFNSLINISLKIPWDWATPIADGAFFTFEKLGTYHLKRTTEYLDHPKECTGDPYVWANMVREQSDIPAVLKVLDGRTDNYDEIKEKITTYYESVDKPTLCSNWPIDIFKFYLFEHPGK